MFSIKASVYLETLWGITQRKTKSTPPSRSKPARLNWDDYEVAEPGRGPGATVLQPSHFPSSSSRGWGQRRSLDPIRTKTDGLRFRSWIWIRVAWIHCSFGCHSRADPRLPSSWESMVSALLLMPNRLSNLPTMAFVMWTSIRRMNSL